MNPFKNKIFVTWFENALLNSFDTLLDPFAGTYSLIEMLPKTKDYKVVAYDIHPRNNKVIQRDTIENYPTNYKFVVSAIPILSIKEAKQINYKFPNTNFDDVYKLTLDLIIKYSDYAAIILPKSFLTLQNEWANNIKKYIYATIELDNYWHNLQKIESILILFEKMSNK